MRNVYIIGADILKFGKYTDVEYRELTNQTVTSVLADAGLQKEDIQSAHFGNCLWGYFTGQHGVRGQIALRYCGFELIPVTNHESACTTGALALHTAYKDILTGLYECSLAVGVEKLSSDDKMKQIKAFEGFSDVARKHEQEQRIKEELAQITIEVPKYEGENKTIFVDGYGIEGRKHMQAYGTTMRQFAYVAAKNHHFGSLNPKAQYQFDMTVDEVMNDRIVSFPLTRAMVSPMGDGAASAIVCSGEFLKKLPKATQGRAVKICASIYIGGRDKDEAGGTALTTIAADMAYKASGKKPEDIQVAEVHDASSVGEIRHYENLRFCPKGLGGPFAESAATNLGGKIVVNPSGGLISRGHPLAASGLAQIYELVAQLRGECGVRQVKDAKVALAHNMGGMVNGTEAGLSIHILEGFQLTRA